MFWDGEVTSEEEEKMIVRAAEIIHKYEMETPSIIMVETFKALVIVGGQMGRFFAAPFLPIIGEGFSEKGEKFFQVFEKRENLEKLIALLEEMTKEESKFEKGRTSKKEEATTKKGWRRLLPF